MHSCIPRQLRRARVFIPSERGNRGKDITNFYSYTDQDFKNNEAHTCDNIGRSLESKRLRKGVESLVLLIARESHLSFWLTPKTINLHKTELASSIFYAIPRLCFCFEFEISGYTIAVIGSFDIRENVASSVLCRFRHFLFLWGIFPIEQWCKLRRCFILSTSVHFFQHRSECHRL